MRVRYKAERKSIQIDDLLSLRNWLFLRDVVKHHALDLGKVNVLGWYIKLNWVSSLWRYYLLILQHILLSHHGKRHVLVKAVFKGYRRFSHPHYNPELNRLKRVGINQGRKLRYKLGFNLITRHKALRLTHVYLKKKFSLELSQSETLTSSFRLSLKQCNHVSIRLVLKTCFHIIVFNHAPFTDVKTMLLHIRLKHFLCGCIIRFQMRPRIIWCEEFILVFEREEILHIYTLVFRHCILWPLVLDLVVDEDVEIFGVLLQG